MIDFIWKSFRFILFFFDAETVHQISTACIRWGARRGGAPLRIVSGTDTPGTRNNFPTILGLPFLSRVGLAAGFDKDGELLRGLPDLGFGFAEVGTVTPRPQPGNPRPRLFRDPSKGALFNRMGFNSAGAEAVVRNVSEAKPYLPEGFQVGINVGKNKDTGLENAAQDYRKAISPFQGLANYVVVNVSSPNTPGLRDLQTVEALKPILSGVKEEISKWTLTPPLLLKIAPEVTPEALAPIVEAAERSGVKGWVMTNTLAGKWIDGIAGGWSGAPLTELSTLRLVAMTKLTRLPIISVGGILSVRDGLERIRLGASLIQIYTGWIYGGPRFPSKVAAAVKAELDTASRGSVP